LLLSNVKTFGPQRKNEQDLNMLDVCSCAMNHYVSLSLTNRKSSDHLHALYFPRTVLRTFTPRRDQLVTCGRYFVSWSRGSSGSIVSDYELDNWAIGVRSPAGAKGFSSILCVQTGSGAHSASCTMGTVGPFPGDKARPGRDADHSPPSSAEVVNE
jgi:hypothetical protein